MGQLLFATRAKPILTLEKSKSRYVGVASPVGCVPARRPAPVYDPSMAFDGAGKPYRGGPSWRGAIIILVGAIVLLVLGWVVVYPLFFD
jgi:hypothetical protein